MADENGDGALEGVSRAEFTELMATVSGLGTALDDLREASTRSEKVEAQADVAEAKADLKSIAKDLGISPKALEQAAEQARRQERKDELRPLLLELLDEELADDADSGDDEKPVKDAAAKVKDEVAEVVEDSAPSKPHWSERPLSELLGG